MAQIILHQLEISPFCDKVRRVLAFKGLRYETRNVPMVGLGSLKRLSPVGKVPILEIDGRVLHDSSDICRALEEYKPTPSLLPVAPRDRALVDLLEDWADESLYFFEMTMRFTWPYDRERWVTEILKYDNPLMRKIGRPIVPYLTRTQGIQQGLARRSEEDVVRELSRHVGSVGVLLTDQKFLVGGALTLADIAVVAQLRCVAGARAGMAILRENPSVIEWISRVDAMTGEASL